MVRHGRGHPRVRIQDFYHPRSSLVGNDRLAGLAHPNFDFELDGWSAAVALVQHVASSTESDPRTLAFRRMSRFVLEREVDPSDLTVEALAVWTSDSPPALGTDSSWFWIEADVEDYWIAACRRETRGNPVVAQEQTFPRPRRDSSGNPTTTHDDKSRVRVREPLAMPFPKSDRFPFLKLDAVVVPHSAIFFASRLYRLRQLDRRLSQLASSPRRGLSTSSKEVHELESELERVLVGMVLYFGAMSNLEGGLERLRFDFASWRQVYDAGTAWGSEVFGVKDGFGLNREWVDEWRRSPRRSEGRLGGVVKRWIPGDTVEEIDARKAFDETAREMENELWRIFDSVSSVPRSISLFHTLLPETC
ncbi:hypothetical protein JCM11491_002403 [Sporobolomyces phaffii]